MRKAMIRHFALSFACLAITASSAWAVGINTNDPTSAAYLAFVAGATVQNFETVAGKTPLGITAYVDGTAVPASAQFGLEIPGLFFHSGGGSVNDPVGNPGTPVALLALQDDNIAGNVNIAGNAHSPTNVVAPLEINTQTLGLNFDFLEISFSTPVNRVGVWLNPALGNAMFNAQDATLSPIESVAGTAGNFIGISLPTNSIKNVSIIGGATGFTIDDLTYGTSGAVAAVPEPSTLLLFAPLAIGIAFARWKTQS